MEPSKIKPSPIQYVDTTLLSANVCKTLEVKNVVPSKTPKLIEELGNVLNECIERNKTGEPSKLLVFPAKTGTSKSLTTKTYISMLEETASIVVVPRVDDALAFCKDINTFSGDNNYARCYYSLRSNTDNPLRVGKSALTNHRCIVITHKMFLTAHINREVGVLESYGTKKRELVVIDERINLSKPWTIDNREVDKFIEFVKNLHSSRKGSEFKKELEQLMLFNCHMEKENKFCTNSKILEADFEPLYSSSEEPWSFHEIQKVLNNPNSEVCKLYGYTKSTITDGNEEKLKEDLTEQLSVIELAYFNEHSFHKVGKTNILMVHRKVESLLGSAVVLDATANIHAHYKATKILRPDDIELFKPTNPRIYNNLTINKAKGYTQSRDYIYVGQSTPLIHSKAKGYIEFARAQLKSSDDKVLIVTFNKFVKPLEKYIKKTDHISITNYGNHVGKNDWDDHNKVIIIGWNYLSDATILGNYLSATGDVKESFSYIITEIKDEYQKTGIVDDLVQATMRGTARRTIDKSGNCPESEVFLFYPDTPLGKEIISMYEDEFTGAKAIECTSIIPSIEKTKKKKTDNQEKIIEFLEKEIKKGKKIIKDIEVKDSTKIPRSTYSDIVKDEEFLRKLEGMGYKHGKIVGMRGGAKGYIFK